MKLSDNMYGAVLMAGSMAAFATNDAFLKQIGDAMPFSQIVVLRGILATGLMAVLTVWMRQFSFRYSRHDWFIVLLRSAADIATTWFFLSALFVMPLANLHAILQALPLTVALAAAVFLRERIGWQRLLAILVGFVGVVLIVRPGPEGFSAGAFYGMGAVAMITLRDLASRQLSADVPSMGVSFITSLLVTLFFAAYGVAETWQPVTPSAAISITFSALAVFFGYLFSLMTMRVGDVGYTAPFRYTGLIWALILGWLFFGDWPDGMTLLGAGIVAATGLFTLYRERAPRA